MLRKYVSDGREWEHRSSAWPCSFTFIPKSGSGLDGGRGRACFYLLSVWFDFHCINFPGRERAPQVNAEEPQIRPGLYSHNFLILPALDTAAQAASLCKSPPRILVHPLSILTPHKMTPPHKHNSQEFPDMSDPKHIKGAQRQKKK